MTWQPCMAVIQIILILHIPEILSPSPSLLIAFLAILIVCHSNDYCSSRCSNVFDPVCGEVHDGASKDIRRYQNICHFNKIKCILGHSFGKLFIKIVVVCLST